MASHVLLRDNGRPHRGQTRLIRLGWRDFWLLGGILAGMLALVLMIFFILLFSR